MIRLARCTQAAKAGRYFRLHLQAGDHAAKPIQTNFTLRPRWHGTAIPEVGLSHLPPTAQHLTRLGRGLHPTQAVRLAPAINRKRAYYDLTIAGTKSVSLAALLRPGHPTAQNVLQAHIAAVEKVAEEMGKLIEPRSGQGPVRWLGVTFHHTHTREGDPHLHSHIVLPNITMNASGQWRAMQVKIAGVARQRVELLYGHELTRQLRKAGLGEEIVMRSNGLPELRSLRGLRPVFARARTAIQNAARDADAKRPIKPPSAARVDTESRIPEVPVHPHRAALRRRQRLADDLRKPKARAADDPAQLRDEAERWLYQLSSQQVRGFDAVLDAADPTKIRRMEHRVPRASAGVNDAPTVAATILRARNKVPFFVHPTPAVIFKLAVAESAGRHDWEKLRQGMRDYLRESEETLRQVLAFVNEDSERIEAARIVKANLPQPLRGEPVAMPAASVKQVGTTTGTQAKAGGRGRRG